MMHPDASSANNTGNDQQQQQQQQQPGAASSTSQPTNHPDSNGNRIAPSQQQNEDMIVDDDPLLIAQTLTYVTDDGSVVQTFTTSPFSLAFKIRFIVLETIFVLLLVCAVPIGAHGTVVAVSVVNLILVAWFWYNLVRTVEITTDGSLRFYIGNIEIDVPFGKIVSMRRIALSHFLPFCTQWSPYRGFLSNPTDGVCIVTTVPSTPFWLWPRSAGKPDRTFCFGILSCPRLTIVFSPQGGGLGFIREVENEMRQYSTNGGGSSKGRTQPPAFDPKTRGQDLLDV